MVENFSSAYYLAQLLITPHSGQRAIVQNDWFGQYRRKSGCPLVMKVKNRHIPVYEESSVPSQVLALPRNTFNALDILEDEPTNVFLAKEETAELLMEMKLVDENAG